MKITRQIFLDQPSKRISLIGMSGVGKSFIASKLEEWGWFNYSCDYLIATEYLADQVDGAVTADNILNLSEFVGQVGNPAQGGVALDEFRRRQQMYYDAECAVLEDIPSTTLSTQCANRHFVNDSSGSMCEVEDGQILRAVGEATLFVYLQVRQSDHAQILDRAVKYPKPLYFPPAFFEERVTRFLERFDVGSVDEIEPHVFLSWVFPYLFESRIPKYKALADRYGVTISTGVFENLESEEEFIQIVADHLDE